MVLMVLALWTFRSAWHLKPRIRQSQKYSYSLNYVWNIVPYLDMGISETNKHDCKECCHFQHTALLQSGTYTDHTGDVSQCVTGLST